MNPLVFSFLLYVVGLVFLAGVTVLLFQGRLPLNQTPERARAIPRLKVLAAVMLLVGTIIGAMAAFIVWFRV